jgi:hypothetical protein
MTPEDRLAVMELIADYAFFLDEGNLDGYAGNFAPDAVLSNRAGNLVGRQAIRDYVAHLIEIGRVGSRPMRLAHVLGVPKIEGDSERCHAETYIFGPGILDAAEPTRIGFRHLGIYIDEIVKVDGRWRFAHRTHRVDLAAPGT